MARQQMLCIVTPQAPAQVREATRRQLDDALRATGCVHFATLALLPGPAEPDTSAGPGLLFEIVVDDGIDSAAAIDRLLAEGLAPLWHLYRHAWPGAPDAGTEARRSWLREYLLANAEPAACGFIGARDRSVAQILAEARLLQDARQLLAPLRGLVGEAAPPRDELAGHILQWATHTHPGLLVAPARRSLWRRGVLPWWAKWPLLALRLVVPALAALAALGWLGFMVALLGHGLGGVLDAWVPTAWVLPSARTATQAYAIPGLAALVLAATLLAFVPVMRLVEALPAMLGFTVLASVWALALLTAMVVQGEWRPFWCGMQLVVAGLAAGASVVGTAGAALGLATLPKLSAPPHFAWVATAVATLLALLLTWGGAVAAQAQFELLLCTSVGWWPAPELGWGQRAAWLIASILLVALLALVQRRAQPGLRRALARWLERKDLPAQALTAPQHQVHPTIDACEAALTGRQSHMISLTELRRRAGWRRFWLRLTFWAVNQLADVYFTEGRLGAADGIKFGHWRLIDRGRRLLFCSNYDGSFGGYLDEFIRGASQGVNLIWRHTELRPRPATAPGQPAVSHAQAFPPTRALIGRGCKYEQAFKAYARASMVPHLHRFEAYNLSLQDIERATRLRDALCLPRGPAKMDQILRALES